MSEEEVYEVKHCIWICDKERTRIKGDRKEKNEYHEIKIMD